MSNLFTTVHGSRLYGFHHDASDFDLFTVTDDSARRVRQHVTGRIDVANVGLNHFLSLAHSGSHQSVEALFSPVKEWTAEGEKYRPMIEATRITGGAVFEKYERTIRKFCYGDFKRRRHAVRLSINLCELRDYGRIWPRLIAADVRAATRFAEKEGDDLASYLGVGREAE